MDVPTALAQLDAMAPELTRGDFTYITWRTLGRTLFPNSADWVRPIGQPHGLDYSVGYRFLMTLSLHARSTTVHGVRYFQQNSSMSTPSSVQD